MTTGMTSKDSGLRSVHSRVCERVVRHVGFMSTGDTVLVDHPAGRDVKVESVEVLHHGLTQLFDDEHHSCPTHSCHVVLE